MFENKFNFFFRGNFYFNNTLHLSYQSGWWSKRYLFMSASMEAHKFGNLGCPECEECKLMTGPDGEEGPGGM